jgi:hypothetical protein
MVSEGGNRGNAHENMGSMIKPKRIKVSSAIIAEAPEFNERTHAH